MTDKALREAIENSIGKLEAQVEEMNARFQATKAEHAATMRRAGQLLERIFGMLRGK